MTNEAVFHTLFWILFAGVLVMRGYFILRLRRDGAPVMPDEQAIEHEGKGLFAFRLTIWLLMIAILISYALNLAWLDTFYIAFPDWLRWFGFGLGVVSLLFWTWTQAALGTQWSPQLRLREKHRLVTDGPYAHIRHPMYTAITGYGVALALVGANWIFVGLALMVIIGLAVRIPREEKMLIDEFGDEYRRYMQRTGSVLPRAWIA